MLSSRSLSSAPSELKKGHNHGIAGVLSHGEPGRTLHILPGSGAERRPHDSSIARSSLLFTDVSAAADAAGGQIPSGCPRLSRLRTQRLARPNAVRLHLRPYRFGVEWLHRSTGLVALHALHAGLWWT